MSKITAPATVTADVIATLSGETRKIITVSRTAATSFGKADARFKISSVNALLAVQAEAANDKMVTAAWKSITEDYATATGMAASSFSGYLCHMRNALKAGMSLDDIRNFIVTNPVTGKERVNGKGLPAPVGLSSLGAYLTTLKAPAEADAPADADAEADAPADVKADISKLMATVIRNLESVADAQKSGALLDAGQWAQLRLIASGIERREADALKIKAAPAPVKAAPVKAAPVKATRKAPVKA